MDKPKPSFKTFFLYPLETKEAAKLARIPALIFSVFRAATWSIVSAVGIFSQSIYGKWSILYAVLFILISLGRLHLCPLMIKENRVTLILSYHPRDSRPINITEKPKTYM